MDYVWMTHPTLSPTEKAKVPEETFPYWESRGWAATDAPAGSPAENGYVNFSDLTRALTGTGPIAAAIAAQITAATAGLGSGGAGGGGSAPTAWAKPWLAALGARLYSPVSITVTGSSTTEGAVATVTQRRATARMGQILQAAYNPAGVLGGFHAKFLDTGWAVAGGATSTTAYGALGRRSYSLPNAATLTRTDTCTGYVVQYGQGPGAAPFTVKIDGAVVATIAPDTTGAVRSDGSWTSGVLPRGAHTLLVTATAAGAVVDGAYVLDGDAAAGIRVYTDGFGGASVADYTASKASRFTQLSPGLVVIIAGATEFGAGTPVSTFKSNLQALIAQRKAALALPASFLLVGTFARPDVTSRPWAPYLAAMQEIADADPASVGYVDLSTQFPPDSTTSDPYNVIADGDIHLTDRGHALLGDLLAGAVLTLTSTRPSSGVTAPPTTAPAVGYSPLALPGLAYWYDPSSIALADGAAVDSWVDKSPSTHAAVGTTTTRPTYKPTGLNGAPAVLFAQAGNRVVSPAPATASTFTLVATIEPTLTGARTIVGATVSGGLQIRVAGSTAGTFIVALINQGTAVLAQTSAGAVAARAVLAVVWDGTTATFRVNGAAVASSTTATTAFSGTSTTVIGSKDTPTGDPYSGQIGDLVKCVGVLSGTNIALEEQRQAAKYAIALAP